MRISKTDEEELGQQLTAFYLALGQFFHAFTELEYHFACIVHHVLDPAPKYSIQSDVALAVCAGMRMAPLRDTIKRLLRVTNAPDEILAFIEHAFKQLSEIQYFRDRLAHHQTRRNADADPGGKYWISEDIATVREWSRSQHIEFDTKAMLCAARDLVEISDRTDGIFKYYVKDGQLADVDPKPLTWRYKPSMLVRRPRKKP